MSTGSIESDVPEVPEVIEWPPGGAGRGRHSWLVHIERRRKTVLVAAVIGGLLGEVMVNVMHKQYEAKATMFVVPVDDPTALHGTNALDAANATLPFVLSVLRSQRTAEETVRRLQLDAAWGVSPGHSARRIRERLTINTDRKANLISIAFEDQVPTRARDVVASLASQAKSVSTELWAERDREHQQRLERELLAVDKELGAAEEALRTFREQEHVVDLPTQTIATVQQAAALERLRIDKTLDLRYARGFGQSSAIEVQKAMRERRAAESELEALRSGPPSSAPLLPLDRIPQIEVEQAHLKRIVDERSARHALLAQKVSELEAAQARPGGFATLIDAPSLPLYPSGPSTVKLVGAGAVFGALLAATLVLILGTRRARSVVDDERLPTGPQLDS